MDAQAVMVDESEIGAVHPPGRECNPAMRPLRGSAGEPRELPLQKQKNSLFVDVACE